MSDDKTIFEGLYQIDWANIRHFYDINVPYRIPHEIRNLLASDSEIRYDARGFLFGGLDDLGIIDESTLHILPFVLEILALEESPNKVELVEWMQELIFQRYSLWFERNPKHQQDYKAVYDLLESHSPVFLSLLDSGDWDLRTEAVQLIGAFEGTLVPLLTKRFECERETSSQIACLKSLEHMLLTSHINLKPYIYPRIDFEATIRSNYIRFLWSLFQQDLSKQVRYVIAQVGLKLADSISLFQSLRREVPDSVAPFLIESFKTAETDGEREEILSTMKLLPQAHTVFKTLLSSEKLRAEDRSLIMDMDEMWFESFLSHGRDWLIKISSIFSH